VGTFTGLSVQNRVTLLVSHDLQVSSMLSLRLYDEGSLFMKDTFLGGIERPISEFLSISGANHRGEISQTALSSRSLYDSFILQISLSSWKRSTTTATFPTAVLSLLNWRTTLVQRLVELFSRL
jgi:hypothetical protein